LSTTTSLAAVCTCDAENRLTEVEDFVAGNPAATTTSTYRYHGLGRRIGQASTFSNRSRLF